jgi:hypothetical protein
MASVLGYPCTAARMFDSHHSGVTHHCAGCTGGAPCPECGGNVSRDAPAYAALDWAVRTNEARGAVPAFWAAAAVFTALRDADLPRTAETEAIEHLVGEAVARVNKQGASPFGPPPVLFSASDDEPKPAQPAPGAPGPGQPGPPVAPAPPGGERPSPVITPPDELEKWKKVLKDALGPDGNPYNPGIGWKRKPGDAKCCLKTFEYPKCWKPELGRGRVGIMFRAELEYIEDPERGCYCACCVFRQFIHHSSTYDGNKTGDPSDKPRLDWDTDPKTGKKRMYGGGRPDGSNRGDADDPGAEGGKVSGNGCKLCVEDHPSMVTPYGYEGEYTSTWDFIGTVYDRCNDWAIVAAKRFSVSMSFALSFKESGTTITWKKKPGLSKDVPPDASRDDPKGTDTPKDDSCEGC